MIYIIYFSSKKKLKIVTIKWYRIRFINETTIAVIINEKWWKTKISNIFKILKIQQTTD